MSSYGKKDIKKRPTYFKASKMPKEYKAKKLVFQPKSMVVEKKDFNVAVTAGVLPAAGVWSAVSPLSLVVQGTGPNDRIGKGIALKNVNLRFEALTAGFIPCRILVIYDKQPTGSLPAITDVLTTDTFTAHGNLLNCNRFVTLVDSTVNPGGSNCTTEQFRKCELPLIYKATAGTIADFATGAVYFMCSASATLAAPSTFNARFKLRYVDC